METPRKGSIAFCSVGRLGLITSEGPEEFEFFDGHKAIVWKGIQLTEGLGGKNKNYPQKVGDFWCSSNPFVVGHINQFKDNFIYEYKKINKNVVVPDLEPTFIKEVKLRRFFKKDSEGNFELAHEDTI